MFKSILIANRGEIACRIMRTAKKMGLRTIAVYSDADASALHVKLADEAVHIGPSVAAESYLRIDRIVEAAKKSGAEAVHPGYGFLSENTDFATALDKAGIAFVGPSADAIAKMGDKIESKKLAEAAGVPGVPGYNGEDQSDEKLIAEAKKIGMPVMVKASAGGGGKGMRRVFEEKDLAEAISLARKEAKASFGDDRLLIEKLITRPRHLEVQVAGDKHGNAIHLFERDCSIQRNNQKVLEEAPAPNLPDEVREKLFDRALKLARAIDYDSLGTVEFIMDAGDREPSFLEMNTRLQVEHPVTEFVTGLDLVELQIRIAAGEKLPLAQEDVSVTGHAIEARITAEKPANNFLPDIGTLHHVNWPDTVRVDTGVADGSRISRFYDSMVAKMIAYGDTRTQACDKLISAFNQTAVLGVETNIAFLKDCAAHPDFYEGRATTSFLGEVYPDGWTSDAAQSERQTLIAVALWQHLQANTIPYRGFRLASDREHAARNFITVTKGDAEPLNVKIVQEGDAYTLHHGEAMTTLHVAANDGKATVTHDGHAKSVFYHEAEGSLFVAGNGYTGRYSILPTADHARVAAGAAGGSGNITSDMPGAVSEVLVKPGDHVSAGQGVIVIESMKLLITLKAAVDGEVSTVNVAAGDLVGAGELLVEIEEK
jgi:acetyl-CoA carboxylase biotin carboxylase subunit